jgi:hypothetical protein
MVSPFRRWPALASGSKDNTAMLWAFIPTG